MVNRHGRTTPNDEGLDSTIECDFPKKTDIFRFIDALKMFESESSRDLYILSLEKTKNSKKDIHRIESAKKKRRPSAMEKIKRKITMTVWKIQNL